MAQHHPLRRHRRSALTLATAAVCAQAGAQTSSKPPNEPILPEVVVSATRLETPQDEVAATVGVITAEEIARRQAADIKDLTKYEAGIAVRALPNRSSAAFYATGRGGNEGINIRGLEGNQVMLQVDGVRLPMVYSSGPVFAGRGDYIDVEAFKRVELLRGPSSTSYGSDGLAGAVSFVTKDPADLLTLGKPLQGAIKLGYTSADKGFVLVPSVATRGERFEAMVLASVRRGHETETRGGNDAPDNTRTVPNPQDVRSDYLLGKLVWKLDAQQRLKFSLEHLDRRVDTEVYTLFGDPIYPTTTDVDSREDITRTLAKLDYEYVNSANPWFQRAHASLYAQDAENRQVGFEHRTNTTAWNTRERDNLYGERSVGAGLLFESNVGKDVTHRIAYGLDVSNAKVHSLKDGANYLDGTVVTAPPSGFVVNKSFPDTDYKLFGAFVQDQIEIGRLAVTPGVRYDRFELDPEVGDPLYTVNNPTPPARLAGQEVSPKLGLVWTQAPLLRLFAQYAHGFRAPTPTQVNGGVTNLNAATPYTSIGNPDLRPETSDTVELGLRGRDETFRYSIAFFRSSFDDFIASNVQVGGSGTAADPIVFQSINLNGVSIRGVELGAAWTFAPGWTLSASYAHARGDSEAADGTKTPLATIEPDKGVLGLRYDRPHRWGGEVVLTGMRSQRRNPDPASYTPKGFLIADVAAWFEFGKQFELNLALTNLTNRKYVLWSDARGLSATSAVVDAYSQPGRSFAVSAKYTF